MQARTTITIISKKDLKKLLKEKGIKSFRQFAKMLKIDYSTFLKCTEGKIIMSEEMWNKIKFFI